MQFDPMFTELPPFLDALKDIQTNMDIGCGYGVQTAWLLERFPGAKVAEIELLLAGIETKGLMVLPLSELIGKPVMISN